MQEETAGDEALVWAEGVLSIAEPLQENGEYREALEVIEQAEALYRAAGHIGYTTCLLNRANILTQMGQQDAAAMVYEEHVKALGGYLETVGPAVDKASFTSEMLQSIDRLGRYYFQQKQYDRSIHFLSTALVVQEQLHREFPLNAYYYRNYLLSFEVLGEVLLANGQVKEASACFRQFYERMQHFAGWAGGDNELPFDLARALGKMGAVYRDNGQLALSLSFYKQAIRQYRKCWPSMKQYAEVQKEYGVVLMDTGMAYLTLSMHRAADNCFRAGENQLRDLCDRFPENFWYPEIHAISLNRMGGAYRAANQFDKALECYGECLGIREKLLHKQPGLVQMSAGMATVYMHIGDVYLARQQSAEALAQYLRFAEYAQAVAVYEPAYRGQQRLKGLSLGRLAAVYSTAGDHVKALSFLADQLSLSKELCRTHPEVMQYQDDLAIVYQDLGLAWCASNDIRKSLYYFLLYYRASMQFVHRSPGDPGYLASVGWVIRKMIGLYPSIGRRLNASYFFKLSFPA
ncbi:tetratricopeptide repeat protein [Paraflavitalea pollutisoli]|uniref:tetratricopeptide repeat protein n=1 Tax=Paraflavitalea pollutisoli TaxID=3034143 RepID=UPI0023EB79E3|nr:tetratricopeptide repeat protein [Paraflavitalea sp. H1-2-19X]